MKRRSHFVYAMSVNAMIELMDARYCYDDQAIRRGGRLMIRTSQQQ